LGASLAQANEEHECDEQFLDGVVHNFDGVFHNLLISEYELV
jgi:hypothetical protein